jgi:two-component system, chemotaxis family, response regulator Rcp1
MSIDSTINKQRPAQVLLVEDNYGDALLTRRAFKSSKIANQLTVATSGEEALTILLKEGEHATALTPDLILLDLNLPLMSGQDVLDFIKKNEKFRHIPVVILSSSKAEQDVVKSYNLHANGYVIKPISLEKFTDVVQKMEAFWFTLVVLPDAPDMKI